MGTKRKVWPHTFKLGCEPRWAYLSILWKFAILVSFLLRLLPYLFLDIFYIKCHSTKFWIRGNRLASKANIVLDFTIFLCGSSCNYLFSATFSILCFLFLFMCRWDAKKQTKKRENETQKKLVNWNCHANYWWIQKSWTRLWSAN